MVELWGWRVLRGGGVKELMAGCGGGGEVKTGGS